MSDSLHLTVPAEDPRCDLDRPPLPMPPLWLVALALIANGLLEYEPVTSLALFPLLKMGIRLLTTVGIMMAYIAFIERLWRSRPILARTGVAFGVVVVLLLCGLGSLLTFTHRQIDITVQTVSTSPGVVYERIDPPMTREVVFVVIESIDGKIYVVEEPYAPKLEDLEEGTQVSCFSERLGRRAFTRWIGFMSDQPLFVNSVQVREGS